jgi:putative glutamine amidotransferase
MYAEAVMEAGGAVVAIPFGMDPDALESVYRALDGLLLPGGDDVGPDRYDQAPHPSLGDVDPVRDELEISLARMALRDGLPVLGICRGNQVLAIAAGGKLYQDIESELSSALPHDMRHLDRDHLSHGVTILPGSRLHASVGQAEAVVNSLHHQAVREVPSSFVVTAWSEDGVVEAVEARDHPFAVGVQCHPEGMWRTTAPEFKGLFEAFVDAARARHELRVASSE